MHNDPLNNSQIDSVSSSDNLIDEWTKEYGLTASLQKSKSDPASKSDPESSTHPLHACVINGASTFIYSPRLPTQDPSYFNRLIDYAKTYGINLQACKRRASTDKKENSRRRRFAPLLLLTLGMSTAPLLQAETQKQHLKFTSDSNVEQSHAHTHEITDSFDETENKVQKTKIKNILKAKLKITDDTPKTIDEDIDRMAGYYSKFDKVIELIASIEHEEWNLKYAAHTFQTTVEGSQLSVDSLTVYFDPRSGAKLHFYNRCSDKLPFCVASPADALLHELIHVQSIAKNPDRFIAQGGLSQTIYPYKHEYETIKKENVLYRSMSAQDHSPRPQRNEHSGRHVLVSCVTCLK